VSACVHTGYPEFIDDEPLLHAYYDSLSVSESHLTNVINAGKFLSQLCVCVCVSVCV